MRTTTPVNTDKPTNADIAALAYRLHLKKGSRHGRDLEDWFEAEQLLRLQAVEAARKDSLSAIQSFKAPANSKQPLEEREYPFARREQKATREEIRRQTTTFRPASRQKASNRSFSTKSP